MVALEEDFDRFESPRYSGEEIDFEENKLGEIADKISPATDAIKKNIKTIVAVLVIAIIVFIAYDYFIGSMRDVTLSIENTEGEALSNNRVKLLDASGNVLLTLAGESTYAAKLRAGNYRYEASSPNYETKKDSFTVSSRGQALPIIVEKAINVEITGFAEAFPDKWIADQHRTIEFQVKNNGSSAESIEILFEGDLKDWGNAAKGVSVQGNATQTVAAEIKVSNQRGAISDKGKEFKAVARIKYTLEKEEKTFTVFPEPKLEFKLSNMPRSADAGETLTNGTVKIENNSKYPLQDMEVRIEITDALKNDPQKVKNWFKFQKIAESQEPWKINIAEVKAGEDAEEKIRIDVPLTAKKEIITGKVVLDASFLSNPIAQTFNLEIEKEASFGIDFSANENIEVGWSTENLKYEEVREILKVKNVGDIALSNVVISVKNYTECDNSWMKLEDASLASLAARDEHLVTMIISAPLHKAGETATQGCKIKYMFDNPLAGSAGEPEFIVGEMQGWITITTKPS